MNIVIIGAGAIGGYLGAKLHQSGENVSLIARGKHLETMQSQGLRIIEQDSETVVHPSVTADYGVVKEADYVFLTVKAHGLLDIVPVISSLIKPETIVIAGQNGIPWWYFYRHGGKWDGTRLVSVDPEGMLRESISPDQIIGCVLYPAVILESPGVIRHIEGNRLSLGELDNESTERCRQLAIILKKAGFKAPIRKNIRQDIWVKLLGNVAFNPISALTRATLIQIASFDKTRFLVKEMMTEVANVATKLGIELPISIDQRIEGAAGVGSHETSMLQDIQYGRPMEIDSIIGAVVEMGNLVGVAMPYTQAVYACVSLLNNSVKNT
ncbi:MAG: 2-dehydropantoate 2-reductase [Dehalococcoidia bacterium]|nr:2-dehydropantoate 2-reductase [Dehalococcoidia bacterium]|tara:strand:- start:4152 stop:5126 length:975 start_codon:yes stop_codon:yes gene_type:complete